MRIFKLLATAFFMVFPFVFTAYGADATFQPTVGTLPGYSIQLPSQATAGGFAAAALRSDEDDFPTGGGDDDTGNINDPVPMGDVDLAVASFLAAIALGHGVYQRRKEKQED